MNMKKLFLSLAVALASVAAYAQSHQLSSIEQSGSWYYLYDAAGKKYKSLSTSSGELLGWSSQYFVLKSYSWYYIYNAEGKKVRSMSVSSGEFVSVTGNQMILRSGSWLNTYDLSTGRKVNSRPAR